MSRALVRDALEGWRGTRQGGRLCRLCLLRVLERVVVVFFYSCRVSVRVDVLFVLRVLDRGAGFRECVGIVLWNYCGGWIVVWISRELCGTVVRCLASVGVLWTFWVCWMARDGSGRDLEWMERDCKEWDGMEWNEMGWNDLG